MWCFSLSAYSVNAPCSLHDAHVYASSAVHDQRSSHPWLVVQLGMEDDDNQLDVMMAQVSRPAQHCLLIWLALTSSMWMCGLRLRMSVDVLCMRVQEGGCSL